MRPLLTIDSADAEPIDTLRDVDRLIRSLSTSLSIGDLRTLSRWFQIANATCQELILAREVKALRHKKMPYIVIRKGLPQKKALPEMLNEELLGIFEDQ